MKTLLIALTLSILSTFANAQNFQLNVSAIKQSCSEEVTRSMDEPETRVSLDSESFDLRYSSKYNRNNYKVILFVTVVEWSYDASKDYYTYRFYDAVKEKYGVIVYFKPSKYLSLKYVDSECSLDIYHY